MEQLNTKVIFKSKQEKNPATRKPYTCPRGITLPEKIYWEGGRRKVETRVLFCQFSTFLANIEHLLIFGIVLVSL